MPSSSVKMRSRRPPRPRRFHSDEDAGLLPQHDGTFPNPDDWECPDVSLPPIPNKARTNTFERSALNSSRHDVSPRKPGRAQDKSKNDPFRHRGKLSRNSSSDRMQNFENKVISFKTSQEFLCGDLTCSSEFQPTENTPDQIELGVFDRREQHHSASPPRSRPPHRQPRRSDANHEDSEVTSSVQLYDLCSAWRDDMSRISTSPCKSAQTVSTRQSTRSWESSDLELDLEDEDSLSCDSISQSRQIELQEEAMIALAMERSMADVSFDIEDHSSLSSFDHPSTASSVNRAAIKQLQSRRLQKRPGKPALRPTKSQLGSAGCHLSMIANNMKSKKKTQNGSNLPPMLGVKRASSSEEFDILDDAPPQPGNSKDAFVWERDADTKRWYKRPLKETSPKSEDECILEQVAKLSIQDALKTSLGELAEVTQIRNTKQW